MKLKKVSSSFTSVFPSGGPTVPFPAHSRVAALTHYPPTSSPSTSFLSTPPYLAQVNEYRLQIKKLVKAKDWTEEDAKHVEVCTLDGVQGHERDITIVDFI